MTTLKEPKPVRFLSRKDLHERGITFGRSHLQRLVIAGEFPKPIKLGPKKLAWEENAINAWCIQKIAASTAASADSEAQAETRP